MNEMDVSSSDSRHVMFFYNQFLKLCCKNGNPNVSFETFFHDCFVFTVDLSCIPVEFAGTDVSKHTELLSQGTVDIRLLLSEKFPENMIMEVLTFEKALCRFDASGNLLEM